MKNYSDSIVTPEKQSQAMTEHHNILMNQFNAALIPISQKLNIVLVIGVAIVSMLTYILIQL
jgi:hypothetical protein